jgi:hypothetical protein
MVKARLAASSFTQAGAKRMFDKMVNVVLPEVRHKLDPFGKKC